MSATPEPVSETKLVHCEPQLFVRDVEASCGFYAGKLGFETVFLHGEPPFYAQVRRGGARLNLRRTERRPFDRAFIRQEMDPLSATIALDQSEPLFREYERNGVDFHQRLRAESWGAVTFIVRDPDGNLICFAGQPA